MYKGKLWIAAYAVILGIFMVCIFGGNTAATVFSEARPVARTHCIIIDAGHGGVDGGATSCTGKLESSFNLEIALRLRDVLHLLGYETKMIRTTDISVYTKADTIAQKKISDLKERVRIVNETDNPLLVSIHQNNFTDERYSGAQIFWSDTKGSQLLAKQLQDAFAATLNPGSTRQSKKAKGIYLMEHITCTGVLVECGFLSNAREEALLRSGEYQKKLCCVIASTLAGFLSNT